MMTNTKVRRAVIEAGVWQEGHVVLNSERHSNVKLDMEQLLKRRNASQRLLAARALGEIMAADYRYDAIVPIPNGMLAIVNEGDCPDSFPNIVPSYKTGKREFSLAHPTTRETLSKVRRIAIVDDVLTTGATPLAMAEKLRAEGCEADLDLYAIWRRDELLPEVDEVFARQSYLVEEVVPSWSAEDCLECRPL